MVELSVIIPTMERHEILKETLPSLVKRGFREIIVVDSSGWEDAIKNKELCRSLGVKYYHKFGNREEARNFGVEKATGDWVYILDDDVLIEHFDMELFRSIAQKCDYIVNSPNSYAWLFRRKFFLKIGGYDPKLCYGDDYDITYRASLSGVGCIAKICHGKHVQGTLKMRWKGLLHYGLTMLTFFSKYPTRTRAMNSPLSIPYRIIISLKEFMQKRTKENFEKFILTLAGVLFSPIYHLKVVLVNGY